MARQRYQSRMSDASDDVIVVGGGPAGSASALLLARAGYRVTLLDRARFPRAKACGDCISPGANSILQRLGVWSDILATEPAQLRGWQLTSGRAGFTGSFARVRGAPHDTFGLGIERRLLDAILLQHARHAGVRVLERTQVIDVLRDHAGGVCGVRALHAGRTRDWHARLTIGADGLRSVVARRLHAYARPPRLRKTSFSMRVDVARAGDLGEMHLCPGGCVGIAPLAPAGFRRRHNVTVVLAHGHFDARTGPRAIVTHALRGFPNLADAVSSATIMASGPFDWPVRRTVFDGAALVGDAAGYYDPFTGQGIYQALAGAEQLAQCADAALRGDVVSARSLRAYARAQKQLSTGPRYVQQLVEFVCARPQLAERVFARLARADATAAALMGVTADLLPARALLFPRRTARMVT